MTIKYHILFRACDKIESVHKVKRPFSLTKTQIIKTSFFSLYNALQGEFYEFHIIGDDLSQDLLNFFKFFDDVSVDNQILGSASKSLQAQINFGLNLPKEDWVYMCEDDYLHLPNSFKFLTEFIENKEKYVHSNGKKKNYMNRIIGDLSKIPLIIHPPDYPDRYSPEWKRLSFIFLSKYCHWRQITNTTHTFLLQSSTLRKFSKFIKESAEGPSDSKLSEKVYGRVLFKNRALCVSPIQGLSTHLTEGVMTPLVDWKLVCKKNIDLMEKEGIW